MMRNTSRLRPVVYQPPKIVLAPPSEPPVPKNPPAITVAPEFFSEYDMLQRQLPILPPFNGPRRFVWIQKDQSSRNKPANGATRFHVHLMSIADGDKLRVKMIRAWGREATKEGVLKSASWNTQNCWLAITSHKTLAELNDHVREFWIEYDKRQQQRDRNDNKTKRQKTEDSGTADEE